MTHTIYVSMTKDEDGFPPFDYEELQADPVSRDRFKIVSIPVWVSGIAVDDVVRVGNQTNSSGLWVQEIVEQSDHWVARIIPLNFAPADAAISFFETFNCSCVVGALGKVAADVRSEVNAIKLLDGLLAGRRSGVWDFDLGVVPTGIDVGPYAT